MDAIDLKVFGVAGTTVAILLVIVKVLWTALQAERAGRDADTRVAVAAITEGTAAILASQQAVTRVTLLYEDRVSRPGPDRG